MVQRVVVVGKVVDPYTVTQYIACPPPFVGTGVSTRVGEIRISYGKMSGTNTSYEHELSKSGRQSPPETCRSEILVLVCSHAISMTVSNRLQESLTVCTTW